MLDGLFSPQRLGSGAGRGASSDERHDYSGNLAPRTAIIDRLVHQRVQAAIAGEAYDNREQIP
jgi:hypothetical protein